MNECRRYVLTGRMVQHLLLGVFAGTEELLYADVNGREVAIPDVGELVNNPIKALCWALRHLVVDGGEFKQRSCRPSTGEPPPPPPPVNDPIFRALQAQVDTLTQKHNNLQIMVEKMTAAPQPADVTAAKKEDKQTDTAPLDAKSTDKTEKPKK